MYIQNKYSVPMPFATLPRIVKNGVLGGDTKANSKIKCKICEGWDRGKK